MKHDRLLSSVIAATLAVVITVAGLTCLVTAFRLPVYSWTFVTLGCCLAAISCVLCFRSSKTLVTGASSALILLWWQLSAEHLPLSLQALLYRLTYIYDLGYGWGVLTWTDPAELEAVSCGPALLLLGCLVTVVICFTIYNRKWIIAGIAAGVSPLLLCCVVTDTIPNNLSLMVLTIGLLLMLLPHLTRRTDPRTANRITALLLIPVILFTGVIFSRADDFAYQDPAQQLQDWFLGLFPGADGPGSVSGGVGGDTVDLGDVGPLRQSTKTELYVRSSAHQILYLRGRSYDLYTGRSWDSAADTTGENGWSTGDIENTITVRVGMNGGRHPRYFSYNPLERDWTEQLVDGMLSFPEDTSSYSFDFAPIPTLSQINPGVGFRETTIYMKPFTPLTDEEHTTYLQLPDTTRAEAEQILVNIFPDDVIMTIMDRAETIRDFVLQSELYDLNTPAMPENEEDFALWFLKSSATGYCTHFASAATVLLRAAGIPARYVTGYTVNVKANEVYTVTGENAHAWVEYMDPFRGWTLLDPTPIDFGPVYTDPTESTDPTEATAPTDPTETTAPTDPTSATEATDPTEATEATASTAPTQGGTAPGPSRPLDLSWLKYVGLALAIIASAIFLHGLRKRLRRDRILKLPPNRQALRCWRYVRRGSRLVQHAPPDHLRTLAEKAAFSQHTLTQEELEQVHTWLQEFKQVLLQKWPKALRWLLKLILAL